MKSYTVSLTQVVHEYADVVVVANSPEEARLLVLEMIEQDPEDITWEFGYSSDLETTSVELDD